MQTYTHPRQHACASSNTSHIHVAYKTFWSYKQSVVDCEQVLLRFIGFDVAPQPPHTYLLNYTRTLRLPANVVHVAQACVNDLSMYCEALRHTPYAIACAGIFVSIAAEKLHSLQKDTGTQVRASLIQEISCALNHMVSVKGGMWTCRYRSGGGRSSA
jgi:hypothetical protein